jgi:ATP-dependent helicase/nuclease subunit A
MRGWVELAAHAPADAVVDRILDETGLLAWAASETLGEGRAGVLMRLVEELRAGGEALDLRTALDRIAAALEGEGFDVPLRPGRGGAVRVMNLHQAKGLEAHTVVLAGPIKPTEHEVDFHAERRLDGRVAGWLVVRSGDAVLAQPRGWDEFAAAEADFRAAEEDRLLYVATTRAAHRLVVGRCELPLTKKGEKRAAEGSPWSALDPLLAVSPELPSHPAIQPPGRPVLELDPSAMQALIDAADARRVAGTRPSWSLATVTSLAKSATALTAEARRAAEGRGEPDALDREEARIYDLPRDRGEGKAWGNVIHRLIEGRLRGREGKAFETWAAAVVADEFPSVDPSIRRSVLSRAHATLAELEQSAAWQELGAAEVYPELPIAVVRDTPNGPQVVEGVIDAAVRKDGAWTILDWKTDAGSPWWEERRPQYEAQVAMYTELITQLTGERAEGTIVPVPDLA